MSLFCNTALNLCIAAFHQGLHCLSKKDLQTREYNIFLKIITDTPRCVQCTIQGLLFQTRRKNLIVYKGLSDEANAILTSELVLVLLLC